MTNRKVEAPLPVAKEDVSARVLILAPTANDARLTAKFLHEAGIEAEICRSHSELQERADETCGCILLAEETLKAESVRLLVQALERQPSWSDIPVTIITSGGEASRERLRHLALLGPGGNVSILERPFRPDTLKSAIAVALKARSRQYQVRDLLAELSRARDEAERASRAKDEFLATLSHELRTPLSPVLLLAEAGAADPTLPEKTRADFAAIRRNVNLEARLIDDLLDLTRIARGKFQLDKTTCDVHRILAEAIANVRGDAAEKNIPIIAEFQASRTNVLGDPVRLQQVFWNVLKNAVKFSPSGSEVRVETSSSEGQISVCIHDSGIGLVEAELEHIFGAFSQGGLARTGEKNRNGGLGLGLSISRMLMNLHGGAIRAQSEGPGLGSTFTIELPLLVTSPLQSSPSANSDIPAFSDQSRELPSRRVLLVEDHADTLAVLSLLLSKHYIVVTAASGKEARARATEGPFDLVVSDIGLPDETGYDLMTFLKSEYKLKGIALTGYGMEADVLRSEQAGFITHLTKPVEYSTLERTMANFFAAVV